MAAGDDWRYYSKVLRNPPTLAGVQARLTCSPSPFSSYSYNPSHALAYVAIALFAVTFVAQVGWLVKKRSYYVRPLTFYKQKTDEGRPAASME